MRLTAQRAKRHLDLAVATVGLVLLVPALPVVGLAMWLEDRGPLFRRRLLVGVQRRQRRGDPEGRRVHDAGGHLFRGLRFRVLGDRARVQGRRPGEDPRLTRVGRLLRRSGLEEWPQLWSVLRGHMSLVGPRPLEPELADRLRQECPSFCARAQHLKPGLFGHAQACGPGDRTWLGVACEKIVFDLHYQARLREASPWRMVLEDLDLIAANLASRWLGRGRGRGQDVIRLEYPARFGQLALDPGQLARRTPADLGCEVHTGDEGLTAWWYPPRRRPFDLPSRPDGLLDELCDGLVDEGPQGVRLHKRLAPGPDLVTDVLAIELPPSLQDVHRLCIHLEPVWQGLVRRSADEHLPFSASFLVLEGLARAAAVARPGERLRLEIQIGAEGLDLHCAPVTAEARAVVQPALA